MQVDPENAEAHYNLGYYLLDSGDADAALAEFLEARRLDPRIPAYLDSLGSARFARGELNEALSNLQEATDLMGKLSPHPSFEAHLRLVERLSALEPRLDTIVRGQDVPADAEGKLDFAELCGVTHRFEAAARFYRDAFAARPALVDDLSSRHRLHAAMVAARALHAAPSQGRSPARRPHAFRWRAQALEWLCAERNSCAKLLTQGSPQQHALGRKTLDILRHHTGLAGLRDEAELKLLPEAERKGWQMFWAEVSALQAKADGKSF